MAPATLALPSAAAVSGESEAGRSSGKPGRPTDQALIRARERSPTLTGCGRLLDMDLDVVFEEPFDLMDGARAEDAQGLLAALRESGHQPRARAAEAPPTRSI